jgi:hypothetical protein
MSHRIAAARSQLIHFDSISEVAVARIAPASAVGQSAPGRKLGPVLDIVTAAARAAHPWRRRGGDSINHRATVSIGFVSGPGHHARLGHGTCISHRAGGGDTCGEDGINAPPNRAHLCLSHLMAIAPTGAPHQEIHRPASSSRQIASICVKKGDASEQLRSQALLGCFAQSLASTQTGAPLPAHVFVWGVTQRNSFKKNFLSRC